MKVIAAKSKRIFLVEMDEDEIAKAAGYSSTFSEEFVKQNGGREILLGTTFKVEAAYSFHSRIARHQKEARSCAGMLKALGEMIEGALPEVLIPEFDEVRPAPTGEAE